AGASWDRSSWFLPLGSSLTTQTYLEITVTTSPPSYTTSGDTIPKDYECELIRRWEPPLNCDTKVCPLNAQQLFVLDRREMFKAHAARLTGNL
ncbi:MAG: hypothetical protein ACRDGM_03205, partial [bacterium]